MSALGVLLRNKTDIQSILSADPYLLIQKLLEKHVITFREHRKLKISGTTEALVMEVLDLIRTKGETTCRCFLELLQTDEDLKAAFPGLQEKLRDYVELKAVEERKKGNLFNVLEELDHKEFEEFKRRLYQDPTFLWSWLEKAERTDVVDLMMDSYDGSGSWMEIRRVLQRVNRSDLVQRLTEIYSEPGGEGGPQTQTSDERKQMNLLHFLEELGDKEFKEFKWRLNENYTFRQSWLEKEERTDVVDLMMDSYGGSRSWMEIRRVLEDMKRNDLVQRLTQIYSPGGEGGPQTQTQEECKRPLKTLPTYHSLDAQIESLTRSLENLKTSSPFRSWSSLPFRSWSTNKSKMEKILQDFLDSMTQDQFDEFKRHLRDRRMFMRRYNLETASRGNTVTIMFQRWGVSGAMEETKRVLKKMGSTDLVQKLKKICSTVAGPSTSDPSTPGPSTSDPSTPGPSTSYPSTSGPSPVIRFGQTLFEPGLTTSDPLPSDQSALEPSILDPTISEPFSLSPIISDLSIPDPTLSDMSTSEPHTPSPSPSDKTLRVCEDITEDCVDEDDEMNPAGSEKPQFVCTEAQAGPSDWEEFTPEDSAESGTTFYRFRCPRSGSFHCTRTGLVFVVNKEAGLQYRTVQWDEDLLESASRTPAGPLFSIECPDNAVRQLHFPHCEIEPAPLYENLLSIAHITNHGMSFIDALEITDTHVVIDVPHLSKFGISSRRRKGTSKYNKRVSGQVLLFLTPPNTLEMHLLSINVNVDDVKAFVEKYEPRAVYLRVPSTCKLITEHKYSVDCCYEDERIHCDEKMFDLNFGPNYHMMFQIRVPPTTKEVSLIIQDQNNSKVWNHNMNLPAPAPLQRPQQNLPPKKKLLSVIRTRWRQQLSRRRKISGTQKRKTKMQLLSVLQELGDDEFEEFKWFLKQEKQGDIPPITKKLLENATATRVVDLMVQRYEESGAVNVTRRVLKNMNMNELRKKLKNLH